MSREAYKAVIEDFRTFDPGEAYADQICVYEVSKRIAGRFHVQAQDAQGCERPACKTLKQSGEFEAEVESGPCDSPESKTLDGALRGQFVAAYKDADTTNRGGQTGRFEWRGAGSALVGRMRGVVNAGTHYQPVGDCEKCHEVNHVEGWLRAAVREGEHEGCRVSGSYTLELDNEGGFRGTLEALLICQCE